MSATSLVNLGPDELYALYRIVEELVNPNPTSLVVVDDILTTGAHFKAMKRILNERFPDVPLIGVFVARRVPVRLIPAAIPIEEL